MLGIKSVLYSVTLYSRTSLARTLMARLTWLFKLVFESLEKIPIAAKLGQFKLIFVLYIENGILRVLIRIALMGQFSQEHTTYLHLKEN